MILKTERKKLKRGLKNRYISDVLQVLNDKGITSESGKPFSKGFISQVFNGYSSNQDVIDAIYEVYKLRRLMQSKKRAERKEILNQ